jgi:PAS domain S-box-containing protein
VGIKAKTKFNGSFLLTESSTFFLSLLAAFVFIFGLACLAAYGTYRNAIHHTIVSNETRADLLGKIILEHHRAAIGIVQSYASRPLLVDAVRRKDFEAALLHLTSLSKSNPEIETSWISNPDSTAWVNFPVDVRGYGKDLTHRDWYKGVSKEWRPYVSSIYKLITGEQDLAVSLCVPIRDEKEKVIGILGASLTTRFYDDLVRHISFDMDANVTLVDREGHIIYSNRYPYKKEIVPYPLFDTIMRATKTANGAIELRGTSGRDEITYASLGRVEETGWSVVVEKARSKVVLSILGRLFQIALISLLTFSVAVFFAVSWRRRRGQLETLKKQTEILRDQALLLDLSRDAISVVDMGLALTFWNAGAEALYGWTREEAIGKKCHELLQTVFPQPLDNVVADATRNGRWEGLLRQRRKDGGALIVSSRWVLRRDGEGRPTGFMETNTDVTQQRELEEQLRQSQKMEALGTLAGGIAHDFNNILAAIIGFTELARDRLPAESGEVRLLGRVFEAGLRGRDLIKQMLAFSRKTEHDKKPLRLSSMIKETIQLLRASIPTTISIRVEVKGESGMILADPVQIQQILMNLCTNAAYAMREKGGVLDVGLSNYSMPTSNEQAGMEPGYMKLTVRDTGSGIAPEIMDKIFDPFFTTKEPWEGSGLGLSVVHGIVKQSGGYITVESQPDKGSLFTVYFPRIAGEPETKAAGDDTLPTGTERILFVDDEEALVEMGEEILTELGYDVTSRLNGTEALLLFRLDPSRFDLVITDQTMPDVTGVELAKEILALRADMPIVLCTGFSHLVDADAAKAAGIKAFAMKPLTKSEIARTIRKVLEGQTSPPQAAGY